MMRRDRHQVLLEGGTLCAMYPEGVHRRIAAYRTNSRVLIRCEKRQNEATRRLVAESVTVWRRRVVRRPNGVSALARLRVRFQPCGAHEPVISEGSTPLSTL